MSPQVSTFLGPESWPQSHKNSLCHAPRGGFIYPLGPGQEGGSLALRLLKLCPLHLARRSACSALVTVNAYSVLVQK